LSSFSDFKFAVSDAWEAVILCKDIYNTNMAEYENRIAKEHTNAKVETGSDRSATLHLNNKYKTDYKKIQSQERITKTMSENIQCLLFRAEIYKEIQIQSNVDRKYTHDLSFDDTV